MPINGSYGRFTGLAGDRDAPICAKNREEPSQPGPFCRTKSTKFDCGFEIDVLTRKELSDIFELLAPKIFSYLIIALQRR
jgi:hypothetical protein